MEIVMGESKSSQVKPVPADWKTVVDEATISRFISRICYQIVERDSDLSKLAIVGIRTGGEHLGRRIQKRIKEIEGTEVPFGVIDITLYRDDIPTADSYPQLKGTDLPFRISGTRIILVDDVLYTGRTIRAALDAIVDFGRPQRVELAVLIDRGHRELPIRPDYVGKNIPTSYKESVRVRLNELGFKDGVYLIDKK
jgi:pyrimidine operon attenuation protein / uracil phosphoribosyltransferase